MKKDIFGNKLEEGQKVIYESDKFITSIGKIIYIAENSVLVQAEGFKKQIFNKNSDIFPLVVLGDIIRHEY